MSTDTTTDTMTTFDALAPGDEFTFPSNRGKVYRKRNDQGWYVDPATGEKYRTGRRVALYAHTRQDTLEPQESPQEPQDGSRGDTDGSGLPDDYQPLPGYGDDGYPL